MQFYKKQLNTLSFLQTSLFDKNVFHGFFFNLGGVSLPPFQSLNVSVDVEDEEESVMKNRNLLQTSFSFDEVIYLKQVHGKEIAYIEQVSKQRLEIDGLITKARRLALCIQTADCQPALFYDPKEQIIGAAHAGWRGLLQNIYQSMVQKMQLLGSLASNIKVAIGPSISAKNFEFVDWKTVFPKEFASYQLKPNFFDLKQLAKDQLLKAGILPSQLHISNLCSFENPECFSYRKAQKTGRTANIISLL